MKSTEAQSTHTCIAHKMEDKGADMKSMRLQIELKNKTIGEDDDFVVNYSLFMNKNTNSLYFRKNHGFCLIPYDENSFELIADSFVEMFDNLQRMKVEIGESKYKYGELVLVLSYNDGLEGYDEDWCPLFEYQDADRLGNEDYMRSKVLTMLRQMKFLLITDEALVGG